MKSEIEQIQIDDWHLKVRVPTEVSNPEVVLLLHGWTGDENSMWVFTGKLPESYVMIAPRGRHLSNHREFGGYSWSNRRSGEWSTLEDFATSIQAVEGLLTELESRYPGDYEKINLVGFSQGAALCFGLALTNPGRVKRVAALSGFLPEGSEGLLGGNRLAGIPVFIGHGSKDKIVPVEKAYQTREALEGAGASVSLCETDVGHKLGADCFKAFEAFLGD